MSHTYDEIRSQPETWTETIAIVPDQWAHIAPHVAFLRHPRALYWLWHIVLPGSDRRPLLPRNNRPLATAVPGSEIFLSPASTIPRGVPIVAFVISRSGTTSEAIMAARHLNTLPDVQTVGLTCRPNTELAGATHHAIELLHVEEQSVVMTRSFTNMLIALQLVAAPLPTTRAFERSWLSFRICSVHNWTRWRRSLKTSAAAPTSPRHLPRPRPFFGLAAEATLKLKEMTQVECEPYNPLEFRHGAISTVRDDTAVVFIAGERERAYIPDAEADVKHHGALVATVAPYPSEHAIVSIVLPEGLSDIARCALYLPPLQLLAHERALLLGLDPDAPRNLGHVVVLDAR